MPGNQCFVPLTGGEVIDINVAAPAAGVDWIYTVPAGYEMTLLAVFFRLVTDGTVATRYPMFVMWGTDGFDRYRIRFTTNITAGLTRNFSYGLGQGRADSLVLVTYSDTLPAVRWGAGEHWGPATTGLQAGDQFSIIHQTVCRWRTQ